MEIQKLLFEKIKNSHKSNKNFVSTISDLLNIGKSSVYDRINGKKPLTIFELVLLAQKYNLSIDKLIRRVSVSVDFNFNSLIQQPTNFKEYLDFLLSDLSQLTQQENVKVFYTSNEIPLFYYFMYPDLALFKYFVWAQGSWHIPEILNEKFDESKLHTPEIEKSLNSLSMLYRAVPSTEFWTTSIFDNTLNQILYSAQSKKFINREFPLKLLNTLRKLLKEMEVMAIEGRKSKQQPIGSFQLYHNKITHTNNVVLVEINKQPYKIYFAYDNPNIMTSESQRMGEYTRNWYEKLKRGSDALSQSDEVVRVKFFEIIRKKIDDTQLEVERALSFT